MNFFVHLGFNSKIWFITAVSLIGIDKKFPSDLVMTNVIETSECKFENQKVRLVALKNIPKLDVAGEKIELVERNRAFEVRNWVADELLKSEVARLDDETARLNLVEVQKTQIKEIMQTSRRLSKLPEDFYPKLRRLLRELKEKSVSDPAKAAELEKVTQLATDIITSRVNKILMFSSSQEQEEVDPRNMTGEETGLYSRIHEAVNEWRNKALNLAGE